MRSSPAGIRCDPSSHTRERRDGEFTAGPDAWLNGQGFCRWLDTTWEIAIRDAYDSDMRQFRAFFPAVRPLAVDKRLLTFDRSRAQALWEAKR